MRKSRKPAPLTAAFDRGPAKYFHGRKQILHDFGNILWRSDQGKSGTIFLIQGAPGAGKTALLAECEKLARDRKWKIAKISSLAFWSPTELQNCLGAKGILGITGGSLQIGASIFGKIEATVNQQSEALLKRLQSGRKPLLLILDEAQTLGMKDEFPAGKSAPYAMFLTPFIMAIWVNLSYFWPQDWDQRQRLLGRLEFQDLQSVVEWN